MKIRTNANRNVSRARDDTNFFYEDPWTHWPTGQGKLNRKAQVVLGETELAHRHTKSEGYSNFPIFPQYWFFSIFE